MFKVEFDKWPDNMRQDMRAALLAGVKVLLGQVVAEWRMNSAKGGEPYMDGFCRGMNAAADQLESIYAPSLGEGDGR